MMDLVKRLRARDQALAASAGDWRDIDPELQRKFAADAALYAEAAAEIERLHRQAARCTCCVVSGLEYRGG